MSTQLLSEQWQCQLVSGILHWAEMARSSIADSAYEQMRPAVLFKPALSIDGDQWCALYGDNLQDGVAGFGNSPDDAMRDFDAAWTKKLTAAKKEDINALMDGLGFPSIRKEGGEA
jgi:hypothetical protein